MDRAFLRAHSKVVDPSDLPDIQAALGGDGEAYARLMRRYQPLVARRMWRFTRDRGELEELVHDVFVEAYLSLATFGGRAPFGHWLSRIATRVGYRFWKSRWRRRRREVPFLEADAPQVDATDSLEAREAAERLDNLLSALPPRDRLVLTMLYFEELSVAEAAQRVGWSQTMVKVQAHRARKKLKAMLETSPTPQNNHRRET